MKCERVWIPNFKEIKYNDIEYGDFPTDFYKLANNPRIEQMTCIIKLDKEMLFDLLEVTCKCCGQKHIPRIQQVLPEMLDNLLRPFETRKLVSKVHLFKRSCVDMTDSDKWSIDGVELCAWALALKQGGEPTK